MYNSTLLTLIYDQVKGEALPSKFMVSDNLLGGYELHGVGLDILSAREGVFGEMIVDLGPGSIDTATITDNIAGGSTIHFSNPEMLDIVGTPSIFGGETFTQGGIEVANVDPSLLGDGISIATDSGDILASTTDVLGNTLFQVNSLVTSPSLVADLTSLSTATSAIDSFDVLDSASSILDGLDILDIL